MREIELSKNADELRELYKQVSDKLSVVKSENDRLTSEKKEALDKIQFFEEDLPRLEVRKKTAISDQKAFKKEFKKKTQFLNETKEAYEKQEQQLCEEVARLESKLLMEQERYKGEASVLDKELNQYRQQLAAQKQASQKAQTHTLQAQNQRNRELAHAVGLNERYNKRASKLYALQERLNHRIVRLGHNEDYLQQELENILAEFQYNENVDNVDFQDNLDLVSLSSTSMTESPSPSPRKSRKSPRGKSPRTPTGKRVNMQGTAELFLLKKFKAESDLLDQLRMLSRKYLEALKDSSIISNDHKTKLLSQIDKIQERHDKKKKEWEERNKPSRAAPPKEDDEENQELPSEASDLNTSDISTASALGSTITDYDEEEKQQQETQEKDEDEDIPAHTIDQDIAMRLDTYDTEIQDEAKDSDTAKLLSGDVADWTKLAIETDRIEEMLNDIVFKLASAAGVNKQDIDQLISDTLTIGKPLRKITTLFGDAPLQDEDFEYNSLNDDIFYDILDDIDSSEDTRLSFSYLKRGTRVMTASLDQPSTSSMFGSTNKQPPLRVLDRKAAIRVKEENLSPDDRRAARKQKINHAKHESSISNITDISDDVTATSSWNSSDEESSDDEEDELVDDDVQSSLSKVKFTEVKQLVLNDFREDKKFKIIENSDELGNLINKNEAPIGFQLVRASPWHTAYSKFDDEDDDDEDDLLQDKLIMLKKLARGERFKMMYVSSDTITDEESEKVKDNVGWCEVTLICDESKSELTIKRHDNGNEKRWALGQIRDVLPGQKTVEFLRFGDPERSPLSLSIIHSKGVLNLEIIEGDEDTRDEWVKIMLVAKAKNSESND
jgi:hypothetical protein